MFEGSESPNFDTYKELPERSKEKYKAAYESFVAWRNDKNTTSFCEDVLLLYFKEISAKYKPSSLWAIYSMLKRSLMCNHDINMKRYTRLITYLKKMSIGYVSKKGKKLTMENVEKFIDEAPDDKYLATKVALILAVSGNFRQQELSKITTHDIENHGEVFIVKIPRNIHKVTSSRNTFVIEGKYYNVVKKYQSLRTDKASSDRFFQAYRDGKCRAQVIGKNKFGMMPKEIAQFLKLPEPKAYTGHSFRKSSIGASCPRVDADSCADKLLLDPKCYSGDTYRKLPLASCPSVNVESSMDETSSDSDSTPLQKPQAAAPVPNEGLQCRFCGEFKQCTPIAGKPYLMGEKTSLTLNHLKVELDFSIDSLPKTICKDCDKKLLDTFEFIKQVNAAQFSLVSVCQKDVNVPHVKSQRSHTHTRKNIEVDTQVVKIEFESSDDENQEDSLPLSETVYLRETHKRKKNKNKDKVKKKKAKTNDKVNDVLNTELIIDIKEEKGSDDSNDEISDSDEKPCDDELLKSVLDFHNGNETFTNRPKDNSRRGNCNDNV